jgi:hypothetical protein
MVSPRWRGSEDGQHDDIPRWWWSSGGRWVAPAGPAAQERREKDEAQSNWGRGGVRTASHQ